MRPLPTGMDTKSRTMGRHFLDSVPVGVSNGEDAREPSLLARNVRV